MKVLIADDSPVCRHLLSSVLKGWGYEIVTACNGREAWTELQRDDAPRLAILDWYMPELDGSELCQKIRDGRRKPYTYVILLTICSDREHLIEGLGAGADDYLTKPFDSQELEQRLRAGARILDLQDDLLATQDSLRIQATHDALTGIWNRKAILDMLNRELTRADRDSTSFGLAMFDLDHFKKINDTHGHQAGDAIIKQAAQRLHDEARLYDVVGRYGGEEFLVLLPNTDLIQATTGAERLRASFDNHPINYKENAINVTFSVGVTAKRANDGVTAEQLIKCADEQLYRAKEEGRNRVCSEASTPSAIVKVPDLQSALCPPQATGEALS